jgi:TRAP transporter TAXI family solute receptor
VNEALEVKLVGGGLNWMPLCTRIALGLGGYYSPLPEGSTISVTTREPGANCFEAPVLVAEGQFHIGVTTPGWIGKLALEGWAPFTEPLPLRALAQFTHDDRLVFAVRRETGITSLADIKNKKYPLRVSTPIRKTNHPAVWCAERVLEEYGFNFDDIEAWGGKVLVDRPRYMNVAGVAPASEEFEAIFDEAIMTKRWVNLTEKYDIRFLPIDDAVIARLEAKGWERGIVPKGRFRGVDADVPGIDFSGWILFCRDDMDEELAYHTVRAIDEEKERIDKYFGEGSAMTSRVDMREIARNVTIPLHPGAEAYYREKGYLS